MSDQQGPVLDATGQPVKTAEPAKTEATKVEPAKTVEQVKAGAAKEEAVSPRELDDNEEPNKGERITMTAEALEKRMARATRSQLRAEFGTDDPKVLKEKLARLERLEKDDDERKKAAMSEVERLKAERTEWEAKAAAAEARHQEMLEEQSFKAAETELKGLVTQVIDPRYWKVVSAELADHLMENYSEDQFERMTSAEQEKLVREWTEKYVKDHPALAVPKPVAEATKELPKQPLVNGNANPRGRRNDKPVPEQITDGPWAGKTPAPGYPNTMTPAEFAQWKKHHGYHF